MCRKFVLRFAKMGTCSVYDSPSKRVKHYHSLIGGRYIPKFNGGKRSSSCQSIGKPLSNLAWLAAYGGRDGNADQERRECVRVLRPYDVAIDHGLYTKATGIDRNCSSAHCGA